MRSYGQAAAGIGPDPYALNANCEPVEDRSNMDVNERFGMLERSMGVKGMEVHGVQIKIAMINQVYELLCLFCKNKIALFIHTIITLQKCLEVCAYFKQ